MVLRVPAVDWPVGPVSAETGEADPRSLDTIGTNPWPRRPPRSLCSIHRSTPRSSPLARTWKTSYGGGRDSGNRSDWLLVSRFRVSTSISHSLARISLMVSWDLNAHRISQCSGMCGVDGVAR